MAYSKQTWENLPNQTTPITAERLNHMEDGIYEAYEHGGGGETLPVGSEIDFDGTSADIPTGWEETTDPESYSTDEVNTGKVWIDGKPIYRKVLEFTNVPTGVTQRNHGISNFDKLINYSGYYYNSTWGYNPIPAVTSDNISGYGIGIGDFKSTTFYFNIGNLRSSTNEIKLIVEYTKTTD